MNDLPAAASGTIATPTVARGRHLRRHHARVIENDDLLVVEFLEQPEPAGAGTWRHIAQPPRRSRRRFRLTKDALGAMITLPAWQFTLLWFVLIGAAMFEVLLRLL